MDHIAESALTVVSPACNVWVQIALLVLLVVLAWWLLFDSDTVCEEME